MTCMFLWSYNPMTLINFGNNEDLNEQLIGTEFERSNQNLNFIRGIIDLFSSKSTNGNTESN